MADVVDVRAPIDNWTHLTAAAFESWDARRSARFTEHQIAHLKRWLREGRRSRMEIEDDYVLGLFLVPVLDTEADTVWMRKISVLATHQGVLSVEDTREGRPPLDLETVSKRFRSTAQRAPGTLVYLLIDEITWYFGAEINEIEDALDDCHPHRASDAEWFRKRLQQFRSDVHDVRAALIPTTQAVQNIICGHDITGLELFSREIEDRLRDTDDRLRYVSESLDVVRDEIGGLRDYLQARIGNEQNEIMKALTIVAALVLIPTFVAGFYGQNFDDIPGIHGAWGFWMVTTLMMVIVLGELWYLHHRGWIGGGRHRRPQRLRWRMTPRTSRQSGASAP